MYIYYNILLVSIVVQRTKQLWPWTCPTHLKVAQRSHSQVGSVCKVGKLKWKWVRQSRSVFEIKVKPNLHYRVLNWFFPNLMRSSSNMRSKLFLSCLIEVMIKGLKGVKIQSCLQPASLMHPFRVDNPQMVLTQLKKIHYQPNGTNIPLLYAACIDLTGTSLRRLNLRAVTRPWEYESIQPNKRTHCANILLKTQTGSAMCKYLTSIYLNDGCLKFWKDSSPTIWFIFKLCSIVAHSFESPTRPCLHSLQIGLRCTLGNPSTKHMPWWRQTSYGDSTGCHSQLSWSPVLVSWVLVVASNCFQHQLLETSSESIAFFSEISPNKKKKNYGSFVTWPNLYPNISHYV